MSSFQYVRAAYPNTVTYKAAKDIRASQDSVFEIFERLESFFQRLEIYTETALDRRMVDTVAKIMGEVLNVLAITTNEVKQGRMSKPFLYKCVAVDRTTFREVSKETDGKYRK
jgi:hypothetical protein